MTYSNIVNLIVNESSIWVKPRRSIAHSVVTVTTINVSPSEEKPYRFKKVIKNPNPPISIIWISIITKNDGENSLSWNYWYTDWYNNMEIKVCLIWPTDNLHGYLSRFFLSSSSWFSPWIWLLIFLAFAESP